MYIRIGVKSQDKFYLLSMIGIFLFGAYIRGGMSKILFPINFLFLISCVMLLYINRHYLSYKLLLIWVLLISHSILIDYIRGTEQNEVIRSALYLYIPLLLFSIKYYKISIDYKKFAMKLIKMINIFVIAIFIIFLIDYPMNGFIMKWITKEAVGIKPWLPEQYIPFTYRYASYLGHYIYTAECYLIFFILNKAYQHKTKRYLLNNKIVYGVSLLGILSTGSRTGFLLILFLMVFTTFTGRRRLTGMFLLSTFLIAGQLLGVFDLVINRFAEGFQNTNLTSGRNGAWKALFASSAIHIKWFSGVGFRISDYIAKFIGETKADIVLEYPFLSYFYMYGIVNGCVFIGLIVLYPIYRLLKNKEYTLSVMVLSLFIMINTYNSILAMPDSVILYVITIVILFFISGIKNSVRRDGKGSLQ